ncbi:MAG: DUF4232 domain-containing protein, partial [Actinomycetota bacterium]|nr:DUF4232 domain-containing protein [Actinomycetota bacterium]
SSVASSPPISTAATPPSTPAIANPTECPTASLSGSIQTYGAGGREFYLIVLINTGSKACTVTGFPGVSFLDAHRQQIGQPATRSGPTGSAVTLETNQPASAELITTPPLCNGGVVSVATYINVIPPNQTTALVVPGAVALCDPTILAFQPGTTFPNAR